MRNILKKYLPLFLVAIVLALSTSGAFATGSGIDDQITAAGTAATASIATWTAAIGGLALGCVAVGIGIKLVKRIKGGV